MKYSGRFFLPLVGLLVLVTSGCSVFTPVGDAITNAYENTVSYFNSYYNAKRAFDEAEAEIHAATQTAKAKSFLQSRELVVPVAAKQKLTLVIDKCSSILSFHPSSSLVDDALLLIGKSYFYQGEYVKAERKFLELNEQFPRSSLALESRLWHAKTLDRMKRSEEGLSLLAALSADAQAEGEDEISAEAHLLSANLYELREEQEPAIRHYARVAELDADDEVKTDARVRLANLYFSSEQYEKASAEYARIPEYTSDIYFELLAKLQISACVARLGKYEEALDLTEDLLQDFRFKEHTGRIRLERASILHAAGRRQESVDEYALLDTAFARTETSSLAAYELGKIYEKEFRDYAKARPFYARAAENKATEIHLLALRKAAALQSYLDAKKKIALHDSIMHAYRNRASAPMMDSLAAPLTINEDSLRSVNAALFYEIAEIFYSELQEADSAVLWYKRSIGLTSDSIRSPRVLFVLAEIANSHPDRDYGKPTEYYRKIVEEYPDSRYADQARVILQLPKKAKEVDSAEKTYVLAESLVESSQYEKAVKTFSEIVDSFPTSPYAAKSEYAIAWLYEHRLSEPDSALSHYKNVVAKYGASTYAGIVRPRIGDTTAVRKDSIAVSLPKPPVKQELKEDKAKELPTTREEPPARARKKEE